MSAKRSAACSDLANPALIKGKYIFLQAVDSSSVIRGNEFPKKCYLSKCCTKNLSLLKSFGIP
jgi:hypothetical protein